MHSGTKVANTWTSMRIHRALGLCIPFLFAGSMLHADSSQWADLGGNFTGGAVIGKNADGRLEAFVRGADNSLWHLSQTAPGAGTWSPAVNLGGSLTSDPAVGLNSDGRLEVFGIGGDRALWHIRQATPGSSGWSNWSSLGGQGEGQPAVGVNTDGRLEVVIHTTSNSLWHFWEQSPSGNWTAGDEIVGSVDRAPSVSSNSDGRLILFVGDTDGKFWWVIQNSAGADSWSSWWCLLGGTENAPVIGKNSDGRLQLFAVRTDGSVWTSAQMTAGSYSWTDWSPVGMTVSGSVAVGTNADGRLEVFGTGPGGMLIHASQTSPGGAWSSSAGLGGTLNGTVSVGQDSDGRLEVFAVGPDNVLRHIAQSSPGSWTVGPLGPPTISSVENGASFAAGQAVAPGSLVAIFGNNFGSGLTLADFHSIPLATTLAADSITFNGLPAALVGVSSGQINAEVPWALLAAASQSGTAQVVVRTPSGASAAATVPLSPVAPGLFSVLKDSTGVTRPAVYNNTDVTLPYPSTVTVPGYSTRPVKPNEILILFATGLGPVTNPPVDGAPGLAQPPYSTTLSSPTVLVGGLPQKVIFSGLSPQYPSMYQIAIIIQPGTPAGDAIPMQIQMNGISTSDQLKIAVSN